MVEPVALGDRAGELVRVDRPLLEQERLGRAARGPGLRDRLLDLVTGRVAEVHDRVGDEGTGMPSSRGRNQARMVVLRLLWLGGLSGRCGSLAGPRHGPEVLG